MWSKLYILVRSGYTLNILFALANQVPAIGGDLGVGKMLVHFLFEVATH